MGYRRLEKEMFQLIMLRVIALEYTSTIRYASRDAVLRAVMCTLDDTATA